MKTGSSNRKTRTILVTISGTHGTGKSTHAGRCCSLLNRPESTFSYLRHHAILAPLMFGMKIGARLLGYQTTGDFERMRPGVIIWSIYIILVYIPFLVIGIHLRKMLRYSVISDRYLYDLIVGLQEDGVELPIERLFVWVVPRPDIAFLLEANESRILERRRENTAGQIAKEKKLYSQVGVRFGLWKISTDRPPVEVWENMLRAIEATFARFVPPSQITASEGGDRKRGRTIQTYVAT